MIEKRPMTENERARLNAMIRRAADEVMHRFTVPFLTIEDEDSPPRLEGSGVLLDVGGRRFLATAAHTLDMQQEKSTYLPGAGKRLLELEWLGEGVSSNMPPSGEREDDPLDVAAVELTPRMVASLPATKAFLSLSMVDAVDAQSGYYVAYGYPEGAFESIPAAMYSHASGYPYPGVRTVNGRPFAWYDPAVHLTIKAPTDDELVEHGMPKPCGISGCGIWRLIKNWTSWDKWTPQDVRLVAIDHS